MSKNLIVTIIIVVFVLTVPSYAKQWIGESMYTKIDTPHPYPKADPGKMVWSETIHQMGAVWLKPHFSNFKLADEDYVELVDMYGTVVLTIKGSDVEAGMNKFKVIENLNGRVDFWGPAIDGNELTIKLYRNSDSKKGWGFTIDEVGIGAVPIEGDLNQDRLSGTESICGSDDKVSIACVASYYQTSGRSVGRMSFQSGSSWYVCTGFLVSSCSSHFLTNEHCITNQSEVNSLNVRFYYRLSTCNGSNASYSTYYGDDFVKDSTTNDYCLLTLTGSPQSSWGHLVLLSREPYYNEGIYIPQHPGGRRQEISFGSITNTNMRSGLDFGYYADTEGGSSGSPVMTDQYDYDKVIGLHHYGGCPNSAVEINQIRSAILSYICN
jgi:V8-like Glu-specific endopeptidase